MKNIINVNIFPMVENLGDMNFNKANLFYPQEFVNGFGAFFEY